ncbi:MAG TPA: hypothetical protein VNF73_08580 [Candidatus Saccharimonadales bacterium]|nr:hypothetical protein [Candidatus Saccharimonadales bacterium]
MTEVPTAELSLAAHVTDQGRSAADAELVRRGAALHAEALEWDDHSGFEPSPLADLDLLGRWRSAGVDHLSVNVGYDVIRWQDTIRTLADSRVRTERCPDRYLLVDRADDVLEARACGLLGITPNRCSGGSITWSSSSASSTRGSGSTSRSRWPASTSTACSSRSPTCGR